MIVLQGQLELLFAKHELAAVYLFGSRADGSAKEDSDYDYGRIQKQTCSRVRPREVG